MEYQEYQDYLAEKAAWEIKDKAYQDYLANNEDYQNSQEYQDYLKEKIEYDQLVTENEIYDEENAELLEELVKYYIGNL